MASLKQRGDVFYIQYYVGAVQKRISTGTDSYQLAKEKLRQFESAQFRGDDTPLPTRTLIADVVTAYVAHIRTVKTAKSAPTDIYYLRDAFFTLSNGNSLAGTSILSVTPASNAGNITSSSSLTWDVGTLTTADTPTMNLASAVTFNNFTSEGVINVSLGATLDNVQTATTSSSTAPMARSTTSCPLPCSSSARRSSATTTSRRWSPPSPSPQQP